MIAPPHRAVVCPVTRGQRRLRVYRPLNARGPLNHGPDIDKVGRFLQLFGIHNAVACVQVVALLRLKLSLVLMPMAPLIICIAPPRTMRTPILSRKVFLRRRRVPLRRKDNCLILDCYRHYFLSARVGEWAQTPQGQV